MGIWVLILAVGTGVVRKFVTVGDIGIAGDGTGKLREDNVVKRGTRPERNIDGQTATGCNKTGPQHAR